jgi:Ca2+/Na+ antiporter
MDATHAHLLLNHVPILGSIFGVVLLIVGMVLKNKTLEITGLSTILLAALFTIPVYLTGEEAEHVVEHLKGVSEFQLEEHEEHAELSLWLMVASGLFALMTIASYKMAPQRTKLSRIITLAITLFGFITLIPLANHGGKIMHQELRGDHDAHEEEHQEHEH